MRKHAFMSIFVVGYQRIILTGVLPIGPLRTDVSHIIFKIETFSFNKMLLQMLSGKCWSFCLGLNVLKTHVIQRYPQSTFSLPSR